MASGPFGGGSAPSAGSNQQYSQYVGAGAPQRGAPSRPGSGYTQEFASSQTAALAGGHGAGGAGGWGVSSHLPPAAPASTPTTSFPGAFPFFPGAALQRAGDEIIACGRLFHTGTRVVTWMDR